MYIDTQETAFLHDLSKPSLEALAYILRHKEHWPKGFHWDFSNCSTCAMGLAGKLWSSLSCPSNRWNEVRVKFPKDVIEDIFYGRVFSDSVCAVELLTFFRTVTPEMVADQLDYYIHVKFQDE